MKIAYLILAHDQPTMFGRLVEALTCDGTSFFVHVDGRSDEQAFRQAISATTDIKFVADRIKVNHSGFSLTQSMIRLMDLAFSNGTHDYYIFLSGRDYPIKSNQEITAFLKNAQGRNYINFYPLVDGTALANNIRKRHYYDFYAKFPSRFLQKVTKRLIESICSLLPARPFLTGWIPYRGSQWSCLTRDTISYILDFVANPENEAFLRFFHSVGASDEIFFQTIILNSPLAHTCQNYEQDILGKQPGDMLNENKVYLHYIDWNPQRENPAIFDLSDLNALTKTDKFFARKFDIVKSAELLDQIDLLRLKNED